MVTAQAQSATGLLRRIKDSQTVEWVYSTAHQSVEGLLMRVSPPMAVAYRYRRLVGKRLPLEHPVTFDEKILWLMLYWHHALKSQCADKLDVRDYVRNQGHGHLLVDLLGTYARSQDIDFSALPDRFALKCSHGCGFNIICLDRKRLDLRQARRQLDAWLRVDYSRVYGERQYHGLRPRILCERFLDDGSGAPPTDYKLHCFHGRVHFTTVCTGRSLEGGGAAYDHYDRAWQHQLALSRSGVHPERWRPQPEAYPAMLEAAEALSAPFPYVRMDFYELGGTPFLGEMTFTPSGGIDTGYTEEAQHALGALIHLPEPLPRPRHAP
jgi:hypothetical protein